MATQRQTKNSLLIDGLAFPEKKAEGDMERWKDIPGFEGLYQASDRGNIRTCEGKVTKNARYKHRVWKQRVMKQKRQCRGRGRGFDARVTLWKDGAEYTRLVSRLVAMTWCPGYDDNLTVNHIDGDPMNNNADNLEWVSQTENIRKAFDAELCGQKPVILVDRGGNCTRFHSMASASRFLGRSKGYICAVLSRGETKVKEGYTIKVC